MTYYYKLEGAVVKSAAQIDGYKEISETEYNAIKAEAEQSESRKQAINDFMEQCKRRPLTAEEVTALLIKQQINTITVDDQTALRMRRYYPTFADLVGQTVTQGTKFRATDSEDADLYKVIQPELTIQTQYPPGEGTESLYTRIDEIHDGTQYDPIPYNGNMALENGKYYIEDGVIYLCNRDSGIAVYNRLAELVGIYVELA